MTEDDIEKELIEKIVELTNENDEAFLAIKLYLLDYFQHIETYNKIYDYLSLFRKRPLWNASLRPINSPPASNWQVTLPLRQIVPKPGETVWLLIESPFVSYWPVYEAKINVIEEFANKTRVFEYFVIAKDFSWVIAKNHHDEIIVNGEAVEKNWRKLKDANTC